LRGVTFWDGRVRARARRTRRKNRIGGRRSRGRSNAGVWVSGGERGATLNSAERERGGGARRTRARGFRRPPTRRRRLAPQGRPLFNRGVGERPSLVSTRGRPVHGARKRSAWLWLGDRPLLRGVDEARRPLAPRGSRAFKPTTAGTGPPPPATKARTRAALLSAIHKKQSTTTIPHDRPRSHWIWTPFGNARREREQRGRRRKNNNPPPHRERKSRKRDVGRRGRAGGPGASARASGVPCGGRARLWRRDEKETRESSLLGSKTTAHPSSSPNRRSLSKPNNNKQTAQPAGGGGEEVDQAQRGRRGPRARL
jgi:hypothetical protein